MISARLTFDENITEMIVPSPVVLLDMRMAMCCHENQTMYFDSFVY